MTDTETWKTKNRWGYCPLYRCHMTFSKCVVYREKRETFQGMDSIGKLKSGFWQHGFNRSCDECKSTRFVIDSPKPA